MHEVSTIEKEEKVMIVLLMMVLLSLSVAYLTFYHNTAQIPEYSNSSKPGETVYLEGTVISEHFTKTGGHLLVEVEHNSETTKIFVSKDNGAQEIDSMLSENTKVGVTGQVQEYQGEMEIVVQDINDIKLL